MSGGFRHPLPSGVLEDRGRGGRRFTGLDVGTLGTSPQDGLAVPVEAIPDLLAQLNDKLARFDTMRMILVARLASHGHPAVAALPAEPELDVTQEAAAKRTGIPLRTIRWLTRAGRIASFKQGRNRMVRVSDVRKLIDTARTQGVAIAKLPEVALTRHDRRGGPGGTSEARLHPGGVRRARRRPAEHRLAVGSRDADSRDDGCDPDPPPRPTGGA